MLLVTIDFIPGVQFEVLGIVVGSTVRAKHMGKDFMASFRNIVGGEVTEYTEMMRESREIATQRMIDDAARIGADAIVGVRYTSSEIMQGSAEIMAYGTAVRYR